MPKIVDHERRRQEISEAVRRVILRDGLPNATVRAVVAESGMSSGAIRHYFADHQQLLSFAIVGIAERVTERVGRAFERTRRSERARALDVLEQLLPLDHERRMELEVGLDAVRMPGGEHWGPRIRDGILLTCRSVVVMLAGSKEPSTTAPLRDPRLERLAERLQLVMDGLAAGVIFYQIEPDPQRLRAALARAVDDVRSSLA